MFQRFCLLPENLCLFSSFPLLHDVTEDAVPKLGYYGPLQTLRRSVKQEIKDEQRQVCVEWRSWAKSGIAYVSVWGSAAQGHTWPQLYSAQLFN
jgi:hypothetical protein